jgi:phage I-like protein
METTMELVLTWLKDLPEIGPGVPEWIKLFPRGQVKAPGEPLMLMDDEGAAQVIASFKALGRDLVIDYEHQTLADVQAPAAGWVKELDWRADGLWARVTWTEKGSGYIAAKEYRYHSPVFLHRPDGRIVQLFNVALTNQPKMINAPQIVAAKQTGGAEMAVPAKILSLLGLAGTASEAEAVTALEGLVAAKQKSETAPVACKEVLAELGLDEKAAADAAVASIKALKARPETAAGVAEQLSVKVAKLEAELGAIKSGSLVDQAVAEGKMSPAEVKEWGADLAAKNPDLFRQIVLKARPANSVVPVGQVSVLKADPSAQAEADALQLSINKQLGITPEAWKKHGPQQEGK